MRNLLRKYKELSFEQKTLYKTIIGLCFSTVLACGKLVIGLFTDYNMISIAVYTFGILFAKLECVLGIKPNKRTFKQRNILIAVFLFIASVFYIGFMVRMFFIERKLKDNGMIYVLLLAFISFVELGFAITGLFRITNAYSGIGVGCFIALCGVYILFAPKISIIGREHNVFELFEKDKNKLINMEKDTVELPLCHSTVYGSYVYRAIVIDGIIDGHIERNKSLWKRMHLFWKIICCILSEILLFVWLIGRLLFFFRSINLPKRLERKMNNNGFIKVGE